MSDLQVRALLNTEMKDLCHLAKQSPDKGDNIMVALTYVHGSWNPPFEQSYVNERLRELLNMKPNSRQNSLPKDAIFFTGALQVDQTEDSMAQCLGDDGGHDEVIGDVPCPPENLPALAISVQTPSTPHARMMYVTDILPSDILSYFKKPTQDVPWFPVLQTTILRLVAQMNFPRRRTATQNSNKHDEKTNDDIVNDSNDTDTAIRIFVAGDRSSVGKSSVCLGILGNLVNHFGFEPSSLAYIKPATQSESPQLVQKYCDSIGIECEPIGPLVYYKGFTRAFLAGETGQTTEDLLQDCGQAVDKIARGKKVVLVDGVGFPAVGSICGTDNASVSRACGYPQQQSTSGVDNSSRSPMGVIVVGGSGVGAAVDAFNLNATYFEIRDVPVMGGIFNKLSLEGFYSLENCRTQVTRYFSQNEHQQRMGRIPFGFVPHFPALSGDGAMDRVQEFLRVFADHVNIQSILDSAKRIKENQPPATSSSAPMDIDSPLDSGRRAPSNKRRIDNKENAKTSSSRSKQPKLSRKDIEQLALQQGAPPSA